MSGQARARQRVGARARVALPAGLVVAALALVPVAPASADPTVPGSPARTPSPSAAAVPSTGQVAAAKDKAREAAARVGRLQSALVVANAQLDALTVRVAQAVEAYNGARYQLAQAEAQATAAQGRATAARSDVELARRDLGRFAAAAYRSGGDLSDVALFLQADDADTLLGSASALRAVADHQDSVVDRMRAAQVVADVLQRQADAAAARQRQITAEVAAAKQVVEQQLAAQESQVGSLEATAGRLQRELDAAQSAAAQLDRQRRQGLARIAAEQAAQQAAEAAAARATQDAADGNGQGASPAPAPTGPGGFPLGPPIPLQGGVSVSTPQMAEVALAYARAQMGKPYLWGGAGPTSYDCSGLTMMAWKAAGISMPHYAAYQYAQVRKIPMADARPGDLVFFSSDLSDPRFVFHVGMYVGDGKMIEAPRTGDVIKVSSVYRASLMAFGRP